MHLSACPPARQPLRLRTTAVCLAVAALSLPTLAAVGADPDRQRAEAAVAAVRATMPTAFSVGAASEDLAIRNYMVNEQGRMIVRVNQTYDGHRVWGSSAVIHADRQDAPRMAAQSLAAGPVPAGRAELSADQAIGIAMKSMALKGRSAPPRAELIVFPSRHQGDVKMVWNPQKLTYTIDRRNSVMTPRPADDYVWAYEVHVFARNREDGVRDRLFVVDARTGAILRSDDGLRNLAPPNPPTQRPTDAAAKGIGYSQYNGTVSLDTTRHADGTFALIDRTRGTKYNPYLHDGYFDIEGNQIFDADGKPISAIGLQTLTETHEGAAWDWKADNFWFDKNPANVWGDGKQFVMFPYGGETGSNGQTAAVDAHYGMATTWDFYKNVFKRDGIDNQGTSAISTVHTVSYFGYYYDNAFWSDYVFGMFYSDGTKNASPDPWTGDSLKPNPKGMNTLTAIDIVGHEMTHGVTSHTAGLQYEGESGGLNEATSDIFGTMVEAYARRGDPNTPGRIPATGNDWDMGAQISDKPLRSMRKPSTDGLSADNWYAGIKFLDVHFSSGPLNRFVYFLSQGASASVVSNDHSAYLPKGMTGIGNDRAARIWYKALTEYLTWDSNYAAARSAALSAATDLYGKSSVEYAAVENAFAAVNVGGAAGQPPRVTIDLPLVHLPGTPLNAEGGAGFFARMPIVAMTSTVKLAAEVQNTADKRVEWKLGGLPGAFNSPGFRRYGGIVTADGAWTPDNDRGFHAMTVVSKADPLQYAEGVLWVVNGDADADTEFDAIDLGGVALSWGLDGWVKTTHGIVDDGFTDSLDVTAIVEAFKNAYGGK
jgi:Zn-dependent metalloprotease